MKSKESDLCSYQKIQHLGKKTKQNMFKITVLKTNNAAEGD